MLLALLALLSLAGGRPGPDAPIPEEARVVKVYDGDTVTLENGDKVRLRWVNTPEKRPPEAYWEEAKQVAERVVLNRTVKLLVAPEGRDGYGRIIAGLHNGRDDLSIELLEQGYAHVFIIPPEPQDMAPYLEAQRVARARLRGIWSTDRYQGALHITSFHADARGRDADNVNGEYMRVCNVTTNPIDVQGYTLTTLSGRRFELPQMLIPAGYTVLIHSGRGEHQRDVDKQLHIYLGLSEPLWDNDHDQATLLSPSGEVVDRVAHKVKGR